MSLYQEDDFTNSEVDPKDLQPNELLGYVSLPAFAVFTDLVDPVKNEDFPNNAAKWKITFRLPKNGLAPNRGGLTFGSILFAVCDNIGKKTWKADADSKLESIWACIDGGLTPSKSDINIQDGDIHRPEYNAGNWLVVASRRLDEGPPTLFDKSGNPIYDEDGDLIGDESQVVQNGDFCNVLINVWAQKDRERLNFTVEGVRLVKKGAGITGANKELRRSVLAELGSGSLPELPLEIEEESTPKHVAKKPTKQKRVAKGAAKKGSAKQKSVFRKRG